MAQASFQDSERPSTRTREPATSGRLRGGALAPPGASGYERNDSGITVNLGGNAECAVQYCVAHLTCPPKSKTIRQTRRRYDGLTSGYGSQIRD